MARAVSLLAEKYCKQQQVLFLPPSTGELPETGGVVVSSPACPTRKPIEHAGHVYQEKLIRSFSVNPPASSEESGDSSVQSSSSSQSATPTASDAASKLASKIAIGSEDLYELLELGEKRWHATAEDIKKNFRRISLIYHPDKISHLGEEARDNSEAHFKAVRKAYDILSDKKKRAAYDSIDDVDDSIPSERDATASPERYYEKFGTCFAINSRWSVSDRVPQFGDDTTDIQAVNKFYDFWYSFKSWRDFSFDLEYDTDQAECREEKRWMERQNAKNIKTKKAEENLRIRRLVDLAYKHDPRLQRLRAAEKEKKSAAKQEKRRLAEERARAERERAQKLKQEEEQRAAADKEKRIAAKKEKEMQRQVMRKSRQRLRTVGRELDLVSTQDLHVMLEKMCSEGTVESIDTVSELLSGLSSNEVSATSDASAILKVATSNPQKPISVRDLKSDVMRKELKDQSSSTGCKESSSKVDEEGKESETPCEVPVKNGKTLNGIEKPQWTADEMSLLSKGVAKFPGGTRDRWAKLADFIGTRTPDEVLQKVNENRANKMKGDIQATGREKEDDKKAFQRFQEMKKGKPVGPSSASKTKSSSIPSQPPNKLHFSPKEQSVFETALKKFGSLGKEAKWNKVALAVGRSSTECQQRFEELISYYKAKKQAQ